MPEHLGQEGGEDDAAVMARSLGDPEHFETIYDRHAAAIHRYAARRVGTATADDVAAEVFLLAFRMRARYDPAAPSALPWLYGIATNVLHRHRRKEKAQYRAWARTGADPTAAGDHAESVVLQVAASERARQLSGALARLTQKERDVVLLTAWGELSYEQVAEALRIPVGTVRSRLNRARGRLRNVLKQLDRSEDPA
jgi:RNA polymerase sigma factor (sigma-70 family)